VTSGALSARARDADPGIDDHDAVGQRDHGVEIELRNARVVLDEGADP
jgi:hypothetical protein